MTIRTDRQLFPREESDRRRLSLPASSDGLGPRTCAGTTIWLTGLSGAGKTTIARAFVAMVSAHPRSSKLLDGDDLRGGLNADLGFSREDRAENVRRLGEVALLFAGAGMVTVVAAISPYATDRDLVRERHSDAGIPFIEVFVDTPLTVCESRDTKRLYARARENKVPQFTGVSDPYESPTAPEVVLHAARWSVDECVARLHNVVVGYELAVSLDSTVS